MLAFGLIGEGKISVPVVAMLGRVSVVPLAYI